MLTIELKFILIITKLQIYSCGRLISSTRPLQDYNNCDLCNSYCINCCILKTNLTRKWMSRCWTCIKHMHIFLLYKSDMIFDLIKSCFFFFSQSSTEQLTRCSTITLTEEVAENITTTRTVSEKIMSVCRKTIRWIYMLDLALALSGM